MSNRPLHSCTVLITRPEHQAKQIADALTDLGAGVIIFPTILIKPPKDQRSLDSAINQIPNTDLAIFLSANAAIEVAEHWPATTDRQPQVMAIGPGTASALDKANILVNHMPDESYSSESLLAMDVLKRVYKKRIIIFCGENGRKTVLENLQKRGAKVTEALCYRREAPKLSAQQAQQSWQFDDCDIIISTSSESLRHLDELAKKLEAQSLHSKQLLVISQNMAELAQDLGWQQAPIVASNASDEAVIQAVLAWFNANKGNSHGQTKGFVKQNDDSK